MEIFNYAFMQRAFVVGILLAMVIPCIGVVIVLKRLSMIGDALSHTSPFRACNRRRVIESAERSCCPRWPF